MSDQQLDKLFKSKLEDIKKEPSFDAWNKLNSKIQQKKSRGAWFYIRIAASILLLISVSIVVLKDERLFPTSGRLANNNHQPKDSAMQAPDEPTAKPKDTASEASINTIEEDDFSKQNHTEAVNSKKTESTKEVKPSAEKTQKEAIAKPQPALKETIALSEANKPITIKEEKISIPNATTESEIASTKQIEEKGQTYTFNIEDFQKKKEESIATASGENNSDEDKSAFKKVLQFAKDLKESDGLGELRKAKNELLLINSKKNDYSK